MTKSYLQRWRIYLFALALVLVAAVPLFSARAAGTDEVTITTFPRDYQLYPRDTATNKGTITVAGSIVSASTGSVRVDVLRNGAAYDSASQGLSYSGGSADFSLNIDIDAELADYTVKLFTVDGSDALQATANYVVAGDVYVIQGQSNAVSGMYVNDDDGDPSNNPAQFSSAAAQNNYVRTYGSSTGDPSVIVTDHNWYIADGDGFNGPGTIGQWGLKMADTIVDNQNLPIAVINGAFGGEDSDFFQRNDSDTDDLTTNYGRLLYRLEQASVKDNIRGFLWYQGESDQGDVEVYLDNFASIYSDWNENYPTVEQYYVFQIADFCFDDNIDLREAQRRLPETYSDIAVISTNSIYGHRQDCHYWWQDGYELLGTNVARMIEADFYGAAASAASPPDIDRAYFSNPARTEVTIKLKNVADGFVFDDDTANSGHTALYRLGIYSDEPNEYPNKTLQPIDSNSGEIVFSLSAAPVGNLTITFEGDQWLKMGSAESNLDNISNTNGVGLLTFNVGVFEALTAPEAKLEYWTDTGTNQGLAPFEVFFKGDNSSDPNNQNLNHAWDFGDGSGIDYGHSPYHEYQNPGTYPVTLTVTDTDGYQHVQHMTVIVFMDTTSVCTVHGLNYERFDAISGSTIGDLTGSANFPGTPSSHSYIEDFEIPPNIAEEYGARVRGFIVAPLSGDYEFWVASDDESKVWLYSNSAAGGGFVAPTMASTLTKAPIVTITGFSSPERQFEDSDSPWNGSQWTAGVEFTAYETFTKTLTAGEKYYVEGLMKEGNSGDHFSLGWKLPGAKNYQLIQNVNLCVARTDLPLAPLPVIKTNSSEGEAPFTVFFNADDSTDDDGSIVNYVWSYGDGEINDSNTLFPAYTYKSPGTYYSVLSVTDNDGFTNHDVERIDVLEPNCSATGGGILFERFDNIGGQVLTDLLAADNYPDTPDYRARLNTFEMPMDTGNEYGARFRGYIVAPATGGYTFRVASDDQSKVFLSTDDTPANMVEIMGVYNAGNTEGWTPVRDWLNATVKYPVQESVMINLVAGERYYVEAQYKENLYGDHFSVAWQIPGSGSFDLMLCGDLEPLDTATHNLEIAVETSQTTVPSTGALIEYRVTLTNTSSAELGAVPIQIQSLTDSKHGSIADIAGGWTPSFWENTCWWWIPELWVGQSWTCSYTRWVSGTGELHDVTVAGLASDNTAISEVVTVEYIDDVGPGVKSTDSWAAASPAELDEQTQMVDTNGEMDISFDTSLADVRDTEGILIGDYDFDGVCDMWQVWWLQTCIPLSTAEVQTVLADNNSTDMRDRTLRSLTATWLNLRAGNEYECADMRTAINLSLIWLDDNGNPLDGGSPIGSADYTWTQFEYAQVWLDWYNLTGGNYCAATEGGGSATCGSLSQEAEIGTIKGNRMEVVSDVTANAGAYLHTPSNKPSAWSRKNHHRTDYCVDIPADGWYVIDAWVRTPGWGGDNSFFVRFDRKQVALWDTAKDVNNFTYDQVSNRWNSGATMRWYLTAGEHKLKFFLRENGTQLDRFDVKLEGSRVADETTVFDSVPYALASDAPSANARGVDSAHYFIAWLEDEAGWGARHAAFLTDTGGLTEQTDVVVTGAPGWIEGGVDVADGTDDSLYATGRSHFAPEDVVTPTSVAVSTVSAETAPAIWQLVAVMMTIVTMGVVLLRKRTQ